LNAVLATRLPWTQLEAAIAAKFARSARAGAVVDTVDLFGPSQTQVDAGVSPADRPGCPCAG
jgi:IS5 family transposase